MENVNIHKRRFLHRIKELNTYLYPYIRFLLYCNIQDGKWLYQQTERNREREQEQEQEKEESKS